MGKAEGAGRPPRIASPPARSGQSGPPGSAAKDASALPGPVQAQLRVSEVDELERELADDDLMSPADPAERVRVENAKRRLADYEFLTELARAGFAGPIFEIAATEFAAYGIAVMMAWTRTGQIFSKCQAKGRPLSEFAPRWSRDDRLEIAIETTARALKCFFDNVLRPGKWDHHRGATLKTYFVGACLLQFPNVFTVWATEQRHWAQLHDGEQTLDDAAGRGGPQWADPTGNAAVLACTARECLAGIPDPRTRQAAWLVFGHEASHAEAGVAVGLSADGVEGRLYRLRTGGQNDHR
jgi:hypothetical protein